jgi:uncharacterized protein
VVSAFVAAEADYLILSRLDVDAQAAFVEDLASAYRLDSLDEGGLVMAAEICRQYRDLELGLADASLVVPAEKWSTRMIATLDHRDFRVVTSTDGRAFELLPEP